MGSHRRGSCRRRRRLSPVSSEVDIVCLHGFTGGPESWGAVLAALPAEVHASCPPILGHHPDVPSTGMRFEDEVDRLAESLACLAGRPLHLVGYSMGARLALGLVVRYRDLFASATLIGVHPGLVSEGERRSRRAADEKLACELEADGVERFVDAWQELPLFQSQQAVSDAILASQRRRRLRHSAAGLAQALRVLGLGHMPDYTAALPELDLPIHLMVGERDVKFRGLAETMVVSMPEARVEIVSGVGHNLILEAPGYVARTLRAHCYSGSSSRRDGRE